MRTHIVLGLGFGDEGKGSMTDYLCRQSKNPLVVRFSGGGQAGHTVVNGENRHVFSNFGSGTMRGTPTYWSRFCPINPVSAMREYQSLKQYNPELLVDALCPVTTHYDVVYNRYIEKKQGHGSVGVGIGATIERHETPYKIYAQDLLYPEIVETKLKAISDYYIHKVNGDSSYLNMFGEVDKEVFFDAVEEYLKIVVIFNRHPFDNYSDIIFEGSQGIMLDMDFGFFPNVTRSNTTSKNAIQIIKETELPNPDLYYITRAYLTRHGNGWMPNEHIKPILLNNANETNVTHDWQGNFRVSEINYDLLNYAIRCDNNFSFGFPKSLTITCVDQMKKFDSEKFVSSIHTSFKNVYESNGEDSKCISLQKQTVTL